MASSAPDGNARSELRGALIQERELLDQLLARADDPAVPAAQLVDLVEALEQLGTRRVQLMERLRDEASEARRRQEERSVRQFILRALDEIGSPQNASFLQEYVWARDRISLDTRGFGALRRDERRAWERNPGRRLAYVVSALGADGRPLARWMARSDWSVHQRVVLPGDERLLDLKKVRALLRARRELDQPSVTDPFGPLIEKYATAWVKATPPEIADGAQLERWFEAQRAECESEIQRLETETAGVRRATVERLALLPPESLFWGSARSAAV